MFDTYHKKFFDLESDPVEGPASCKVPLGGSGGGGVCADAL